MKSFKHFISESMVPGVSPGIANERYLLAFLSGLLANSTPVTLRFVSTSKEKVLEDIVGVSDVSNITAGNKKADFILTDKRGNEYPISLKNDKAGNWASADSILGRKARKVIDDLVAQKKVKLVLDKVSGNYSISPSFAKKLNSKDAEAVMFGSDLLPNGFIVCRTFSDDDFIQNGKEVVINCSSVITTVDDVKNTNYEPYLFVRSAGVRNSLALGYKGLRVLAVYRLRTTVSSCLVV